MQVDGMVTAMLEPSPCVCVHLDRCAQAPDTNRVYKHDSRLQTDATYNIPVFTGPGLETLMTEYTVTACQAHLGHDGSGHYRTALRITQAVVDPAKPVSWLLCDDYSRPQLVWTLPEWFERNINIIWLTCSDITDTFAYHTHVAPVQETSTEATLAMLALLNGSDAP